MMEVVVTTGLLELRVVQGTSQIVTTNKPTPNFLQAGCPSYRLTNSVKTLKLAWGLPTLSLTTNSSQLSWEMVAMPLISPLMPVPHLLDITYVFE